MSQVCDQQSSQFFNFGIDHNVRNKWHAIGAPNAKQQPDARKAVRRIVKMFSCEKPVVSCSSISRRAVHTHSWFTNSCTKDLHIYIVTSWSYPISARLNGSPLSNESRLSSYVSFVWSNWKIQNYVTLLKDRFLYK